MTSEWRADFGRLYRQAFAEQNPATKRLLLQEVQAVLDDWGQRDFAIASSADIGVDPTVSFAPAPHIVESTSDSRARIRRVS